MNERDRQEDRKTVSVFMNRLKEPVIVSNGLPSLFHWFYASWVRHMFSVLTIKSSAELSNFLLTARVKVIHCSHNMRRKPRDKCHAVRYGCIVC